MTFATPIFLLLVPPVLGWAALLWLRDRGSFSPVRHRVALALRLLIMGALALVLAGATWQQPETRQATVFVADLSASMGTLADTESAYIAHALKNRGAEDVAAVVALGADALVEQPAARLGAFAGFQSVIDRGATNLEAGLDLAGALFPVGYRKRVVVLTDGRQNVGDALGAARLLHEEGVRLDVVPLAPPGGVEASVTGVDAPSTLRRGARLPLTVGLRSTMAQTATLDVLTDARLLRHQQVGLAAGDTSLRLTLPPLEPGFHRLRVILHPTFDTVAQNNEGAAVTGVRGAPRVLVAEGFPGAGAVIAAALRARGMRVDEGDAALVQASTDYLSRFDAVVLVDVPALELDPALLDPTGSPLRAYVDAGGGLAVIGGPDSYGVGGYTGTALDDLLPVSMRLPQRKDTPPVAVALIVEDLESQTNVNISKVAGEGVIKLLTPADQVEVNDANGTDVPGNGWAVPLQYVVNKPAINRGIDAMNPTDPMSYAPALNAALNSLQHVSAKIKHIILLGDGDAEDNTYQALVTRIRKAGITVSTVATGAGGFGPADYGTMQDIARWGGGRYYQSDNVAAIPTIFLKETKQIARTGIVEEHFTPELVSTSPIVADLPAVPLDGYVATTPKPQAEQVLMHFTKHGPDPVLAQWQYGLGRVVAWTSDAEGRWSSALIESGRGNRLWSNMVSWVLPPASSPNLAVASSVTGGRAHLTVTTTGLPLDAQVTAQVNNPAGAAATVALAPTGPGQYEADVPAAGEGAYLVGVRALVGGRARASLRTGLVVPYAPEYADSGVDTRLVTGMAVAGGGEVPRSPAQAFADDLPTVYAPRPLTVPLLLLALLLLPFDVAARRLLVGMADLREGVAALARRRRLQPAGVPVGTAAAPLTAVRAHRLTRQERRAGRAPAGRRTRGEGVRAHEHEHEHERPGGPAVPAARPTAPARPGAATYTAWRRGPVPAAQDQRPAAGPEASRPASPTLPSATASSPALPPDPAPEAGATSSRLLEAKRRRRGSEP